MDSDLSNYLKIMRLIESATSPDALALLDRRASYYEARLGLA